MIQRIQTLYLLMIVVLTALMLFLPLAWFSYVTPDNTTVELQLYAFSLQSAGGEVINWTIYLGVLLAIACLLPLVTIFCYRNRILQLRFCGVECVLLLGVMVMEGVYYYLGRRLGAEAAMHDQGFRFAIALPLLCLLFNLLAGRAIFRDELLVRAADRIR